MQLKMVALTYYVRRYLWHVSGAGEVLEVGEDSADGGEKVFIDLASAGECESEAALMLCKHPFMRDPHGNTRWWVKMTEEERLAATPFPCGRCLPCKINKARVWVHRLLLEQRVHGDSSFITLTYDDDYLPDPPHLKKKHIQKYLKRLRRKIEPRKLRYYAVGEYGDNTSRPHYHLCLFGLGMLDSQVMDECWHYGFTHTGDLTKDSARYVTGYVIKKLTNPNDPRLEGKTPEFALSSQKNGGLGFGAIKQIGEELKNNPHWNQNDILDKFQHGKHQLPLGRYLTQKLAEILETPEEVFKQRLFEYQNEFFERHINHKEHYYWNIVEEEGPKRKAIEKKSKIYKPRKIL